MNFKYQNSDYFNNVDYYIVEGKFNEILVTKLHFYNGYWYCDEGLCYKMITIRCINSSEIYKKEVKLKEIDYKGKINKFLSPHSVGIFWHHGEQIRKYGLVNFWTNIKNLEI